MVNVESFSAEYNG